MAKKQTQYAKIRKRIMNYINSQKRKGYIVNIDTPLTETQLRKSGIKGRALAQETRKLKKLATDIKKAEAVSIETGEILPLEEIRKLRRRQGQKLRKLNRKAEREFWESDQMKRQLPKEGEIIYNNVLQDFIEKLSHPAPEYTHFGKKRRTAIREVSERERLTLYALYMKVEFEIGREELGLRLKDKIDEIGPLLDYVLYGSDSARIQTASRQVAEAIAGTSLSLRDLMDLDYESEENEEWEENL